jgi:hypothetical protein
MTFTNGFIHREHLTAKTLSPCLNEVLTQPVQALNFTKCNALNSRIFSMMCEEIKSSQAHLLLVEIHWLLTGTVLKRLFKLRHEV